MDRTIIVTVSGLLVRKDSKTAGVQGEANATTLELHFDESWSGYGKRVVWRNAMGVDPVAVLLWNGQGGEEALTYSTPIPAEALKEPGWCSFMVEGYSTGEDGVESVALTVRDYLEVKEGDPYHKPAEPTPSEVQQLLSAMGKTEQAVQESTQEAKSWAVGGTESRDGEDEDNAKFYAELADTAMFGAKAERAGAAAARNAAETAKTGAEAAKAGAETAKEAAETAQAAAEIAEAGAEAAQVEVEAARVAAESAETGAEGAQASAESAADLAVEQAAVATVAAEGAEVNSAAAQAAKTAAESARVATEAAQAGAEDAAEQAKDACIQAQNAAERAEAARDDDFGVALLACATELPEGDWLLCHDAGVTVAVPNNKASVYTSDKAYWSENRITWQEAELPAAYRWKAVAAWRGKFVAVCSWGTGTDKIAVSADRGRTWHWAEWTGGAPDDVQSFGAICAGDGKLLALGEYASGPAAWSEDAEHWEYQSRVFAELLDVGIVSNGAMVMDVCHKYGRYVAALYGNYPDDVVLWSDDGDAWSAAELPDVGLPKQWRAVAAGDGRFVMVSSGGAVVAGDGENWNLVKENSYETPEKSGYWFDVCRHNGKFIIVGVDGGSIQDPQNNATVGWSTSGLDWDTGNLLDMETAESNRLFTVASCGGMAIACNYGELYWTAAGDIWKRGGITLADRNGNDVATVVAQALESYLVSEAEMKDYVDETLGGVESLLAAL